MKERCKMRSRIEIQNTFTTRMAWTCCMPESSLGILCENNNIVMFIDNGIIIVHDGKTFVEKVIWQDISIIEILRMSEGICKGKLIPTRPIKKMKIVLEDLEL